MTATLPAPATADGSPNRRAAWRTEVRQPAAEKDAVLLGQHYPATAAIPAAEKTVLIPDAWKGEHPGAEVVSYVTSAEVQAETDICCTSSTAVEVVESIPADGEARSPDHAGQLRTRTEPVRALDLAVA